MPTATVKQTIRERSLKNHWASVVRDPEVLSLGDNQFEVTVYALGGDYAADIEATIRRANIFARAPLGTKKTGQ